MSRLDLFTALMISSLACFIFVIYLYKIIKTSKNKFSGLKHILLGFLLYALGVLLSTLRDYIPYSIYISIIAGNFIYLLGVIYINFGIKKLFGYKENIKLYIIMFFVICAFFYYSAAIDPNVAARIILLSISISLLFFHTTIKIYNTAKTRQINYLDSLFYMLAIFSAIYLTRAFLASINYQMIDDYLSYRVDTFFQIASILILFSIFIDIIVVINKLLFLEVESRLDENAKLIDELEVLTKVDFLTGLFNRKSLEEKTRDLIEVCENCSKTFHYILIDLDSFKEINDVYGHHYGDQILRKFGSLLKNHTPNVYRYGGDEFIILIEDESEDAQAFMDKIVCSCTEPKDDQLIMPTFSYGVHQWKHGETYDDIMHLTDIMMYENKRICKESNNLG